MPSKRVLCLFLTLIIVSMPLVRARAAGGAIEGTITDPKGAVVAGASVTLIDPVSTQVFKTITNAQGRFKIEGVTEGSYVLTVTAKGFTDVRHQNINIQDNKIETVNIKLEIAVIEESVSISASAAKGNTDSIYQQLRKQSSSPDAFNGPFASVSNLVLKRDAATFTLRSGEVYFSPPVMGRRTGAVFLGEGEITMTPPTDAEKNQLRVFIDKPSLTEGFTQLIIHFADQTFEEIKASGNVKMGDNGPQAARARDVFRDNESYLRKESKSNVELRILTDLYSTATRAGFFGVFIKGRQFSKLFYQVDPLGAARFSPEQVLLLNYSDTDFGYWSSFHMADEYRKGTATSSQIRRLYDIKHHEIDGELRGERLAITDEVTLRGLVPGTRVLPFNLDTTLRVGGVSDEKGRDLDFIQEDKNEDGDFGVILPEPLAVDSDSRLTIHYEGTGAITDFGGGNFALNAGSRTNWYPNNGNADFGDRSTFTISLRYPKGQTFVGVGSQPVVDVKDEKSMLTKWTSGDTDLAVAGFNYGKFKKKELLDKESGYNIEFFANTDVAPDIKNRQRAERMGEMATGKTIEQVTEGRMTSTNNAGTTGAADKAIAEAVASVRLYNDYFGKLPYSRIAMSQQPYASFGQSWPTLVFMPYLAFLDETTRVQLMGARRAGRLNKYIGPHEVAHQWWGHIIGWSSYRDQWMSEGFAEFSASLFAQNIYGMQKYIDFWNHQRDRIVQSTPLTKGRPPYLAGPLTQGLRLSSSKTGLAYQTVYPKGAYILHMLRWMMYDKSSKDGDARFKAMMRDFVTTHYNKDVSTEDFKNIVDKHITREMDLAGNNRMDWFFDEYVYGTEIPAYTFDYQVSSSGGKTFLSGRITQSGVSESFRMLVPVWVDFGKGWVRLGSATIIGNSSVDLPQIQLQQTPKNVAICALDDVLATSIVNTKR